MFKKIIWLLLMTSLSYTMHSQITYGVQAGVNFQNINGKDLTGEKLENDLAIGFNVGVNAQMPLVPDFYIQPVLLYSVKGSNLDIPGFDEEVRLGYAELSLNLLFKPMVGTGHFMLGFGPYFAYGITAGKDQNKVHYQNSVELTDDLSDVYLKRFDAGGNLFFGYEFANNLSFQVNTQLGLVNILPDYPVQDSDANFKNTGFGLSVGYRF